MDADGKGDGGNTEVTAPVTPWERVGLTKDVWDALEIPEAFIRRDTPVGPSVSVMAKERKTTASPIAPGASGSVGGTTGLSEKSLTQLTHKTDEFAKFRVDPDEIERMIRAEADRRWREWLPTKTDRKRPRLSAYVKQVRKEYYP
jgi:hypothetical protein